jgi:hypothetical protein
MYEPTENVPDVFLEVDTGNSGNYVYWKQVSVNGASGLSIAAAVKMTDWNEE